MGQKKEEYNIPIDLTDIFCEEGEEENPLYEWIKEVGDLMMDEPCGRPNSHITSQMGIDVDEFVAEIQVQQGSQTQLGGDDDGNDGGDDGGDGGGVRGICY